MKENMPSYKDEYNFNAEMLNLIVTIISVNESKVWLQFLEFTKTKQNKIQTNKKILPDLESSVIWHLVYKDLNYGPS